MKYLILLLVILFYTNANAQVFRCIDNTGKTSYSDTACAGKKKRVKIIEQKTNVVKFQNNLELDDNKLKVLYTGRVSGRNSRFLRVSIYEETETYMIFYVEGFYSGPSNGRAEFRG